MRGLCYGLSELPNLRFGNLVTQHRQQFSIYVSEVLGAYRELPAPVADFPQKVVRVDGLLWTPKISCVSFS
jgi:hypothetical protein